MGNYYSWSAATVRSGDGLTANGNIAPNSVCPTGWKLPFSGAGSTKDTYNTISGSFYYLLNKYGLADSPTSEDYVIYNSPLYLAYSGYVNGPIMYGATSGSLWSSVSYSSQYAYALFFSDSDIWPSYDSYALNGRFFGRPLRCIAR